MSQAQSAESESNVASIKRPVDTAKHGNVEIAIWPQEGTNGKFFTASAPSIRYKDGEQWKDGSNFGRHDLLDLAETAREAATKIRDLQKAKSQGQQR
jgi:hypothetical protein